jgi:hypothetical protein
VLFFVKPMPKPTRVITRFPAPGSPRRKAAQTVSLGLCLFVCCLPALCQSGAISSGKVFLIGFSVASSSKFHEYWIDSESLPGKTFWKAGVEPFPLTLHDEVARASNHRE